MSLLPVDEAIGRLLADAEPVRESESVPLRRLAGRIAAADVRALRTQPDFDASAMDGYAIRAADAGLGALSVVGRSVAGAAFEGRVGAGEAVRIFTGAPVPSGADTVVIQENVAVLGDETVRLEAEVVAGSHIRPAGNDFREGTVLVPAGTRMRAASIALAASGGHASVEVLRRVRVAIAATGDELVPPGEPVGPSRIVACNGYGIAALAEAAGAEVIDLGIVADREAAIGAAVDEAVRQGADVLVTIGGASVGDLDLVAPVLQSKGAVLDFWRIAMRPGKPLMAGRLGAMRFLGLPGNPASSLTSSEIFLVPLIERLAGGPRRERMAHGRLGTDLKANDHRTEFMRARVERRDGTAVLHPLPRQDSSLLTIFAQADALLVREANAPAARAGESCRYIPLD